MRIRPGGLTEIPWAAPVRTSSSLRPAIRHRPHLPGHDKLSRCGYRNRQPAGAVQGQSQCATGEPVLFHRFAEHHRLTAVAVAVLAVSAMTPAGCGTAAPRANVPAAGGPTVIVVRDDANGRTVSVRPRDRIELILSSSYWHVTGSSAPSVLRQDGPPVLLSRPSNCPDIPGLGCTSVRDDFTALTDGKTVITASRSACGEALRCKPDQTRFTVTVAVRD
jgi:hypothetical protein